MLLHALSSADLCGPRAPIAEEEALQHDSRASFRAHGISASKHKRSETCLTSSQVDIVVLQAAHGALLDQLKNNTRLRYAKVYMKLSDVIEGSFFNEYVKTGQLQRPEGNRGG